MILLLDIGNSRIKTAIWNGRSLKAGPTVEHHGEPAQALAKLKGKPQAVWASNVTGAKHEAELQHAASKLWQQPIHFARSTKKALGVSNSYKEPQRLGIDRWLTLLAGSPLAGGAVVVADAGTALTIDCADQNGKHLGGFIAPGLTTALNATLGNTRFPTRSLSARYTGGLGKDTEACVRQGAYLACLGAIDRGSAAAGQGARKFITGGDAKLLLPNLQGEWEHRPLLVFEGLLALAKS